MEYEDQAFEHCIDWARNLSERPIITKTVFAADHFEAFLSGLEDERSGFSVLRCARKTRGIHGQSCAITTEAGSKAP